MHRAPKANGHCPLSHRPIWADHPIGNNINQIARSVNAGIAKPEDAKRGLYLLDQVYELMFRIANK